MACRLRSGALVPDSMRDHILDEDNKHARRAFCCTAAQNVAWRRSQESLAAMKPQMRDVASSTTNAAGKAMEFHAATIAVSTHIVQQNVK